MKTPEQALTEWTTDAITFAMSDDAGVYRVYTRDAFKRQCAALRDCVDLGEHATRKSPYDKVWLVARRFKEMLARAREMKFKDDLPIMDEKEAFNKFFSANHMIRLTSVDEISVLLNTARSDSLIMASKNALTLPEDSE